MCVFVAGAEGAEGWGGGGGGALCDGVKDVLVAAALLRGKGPVRLHPDQGQVCRVPDDGPKGAPNQSTSGLGGERQVLRGKGGG